MSEGAASGESVDEQTARAFAASWNRTSGSTVYSREQFLEWFAPLDPGAFEGGTVVELGFGNGSLLYHFAAFRPARLSGVELGDTLARTLQNLQHVPRRVLDLHRGDLTRVHLGEFDLAYCIGVLHHLNEPSAGFQAVLRHTRPGGQFHCWVYAREGNAFIRITVDPLRRVTSRLPWWLTKYVVALPLVTPYFIWAKALRGLVRAVPRSRRVLSLLPLLDYSLWIAARPFSFFHHVAFDQLVTPETHYIARSTVEDWLADPEVEPGTVYLMHRNGNSWKFGGRRRLR
jgi:SAM-dependent methyltransferase